MDKNEIKFIKNRIKECKGDINFFQVINYDNVLSTREYGNLSNLMDTSDKKQDWLKDIYGKFVKSIKIESDENFGCIQKLKEEIFILEKMISKEKEHKRKLMEWLR